MYKMADDISQVILKDITDHGLTIVKKNLITLSLAQSEYIFNHFQGNYRQQVIDQMSNNMSMALLIQGENVIQRLNELAGDFDPHVARKVDIENHGNEILEWTWRTRWGRSRVNNVVYISPDKYNVMREEKTIFPPKFKWERTYAMIKPDITKINKEDEIISRIESLGFIIVAQKKETLTREKAMEFYKEHEGKPFFETLVTFMTSGPVVALALEKLDCIREWRIAAGPTNTFRAREVAPGSLRAIYGSDGTQNAVHGSDCIESANRELTFWFPEPLFAERTLAMIKPKTSDEYCNEIKDIIKKNNFDIIAEKRATFTKEMAEGFYEMHKGKPFFNKLVSYMTSGPVYAMVLSKPAAIRHWRMLCGPTNSFQAKEHQPWTIRAMYGIDGTRNAVHGSDCIVNAEREIGFFFPYLSKSPLFMGNNAKTYLLSLPSLYNDPKPNPETLHDLLIKGLTQLAKDKPAGLQAVQYLGEWLLNNNPNQPTFRYIPKAPSSKRITVVFILGGPGSGKGTQCEKVVKEFEFTHLSTGDLLREEVESGSSLGQNIATLMKEGKLVPNSIVLSLLKKAIHSGVSDKFLIDGFPREFDQIKLFEKEVGPYAFAIYFDCPDSVLTERCLERGKSSGRVDDNEESIKKRIKIFHQQSLPAIDHFKQIGKLRRIDANKEIDSIYEQTRKHFVTIMKNDGVMITPLPPLLPTIVFILGGPGSGKGTQCDKLVRNYGFTHLSTGDLLREEIAKGNSEHSQELKEIMSKGELVPTNIVLDLLKNAIETTQSDKFLIDGFPRDLDQAYLFEKQVGKCSYVLYYDCPTEIMTQRILERGKTSGRTDDNEETALRRMRVFEEQTKPVVNYYRKLGLLRTVDASGGPGEVYDSTRKYVNPTFVLALGRPGSGVSTIVEKLSKQYSYEILDINELLRIEVSLQSDIGRDIDEFLRDHRIISVSMLINVVRSAIARTNNDHFILMNFPRTKEQMAAFEEEYGMVSFIVEVSCPSDICEKRLKLRAGAQDGPGQIKNRLLYYENYIEPLLQSYRKIGVVQKVRGELTMEQSYADAQNIFQKEVISISNISEEEVNLDEIDQFCSQYGYTVIHSIDELVDASVMRGTKYGEEVSQLLANQQIIPNSLICNILHEYLIHTRDNRFIIINYPNTKDQAIEYDNIIGPLEKWIYVSKDYVSPDSISTLPYSYESIDEHIRELTHYYEPSGRVRICPFKNGNLVEGLKEHIERTLMCVINEPFCDTSDIINKYANAYNYHIINKVDLLEGESERDVDFKEEYEKYKQGDHVLPQKAIISLIQRLMHISHDKRYVINEFPNTDLEYESIPEIYNHEYIKAMMQEDALIKHIKKSLKPKRKVNEDGEEEEAEEEEPEEEEEEEPEPEPDEEGEEGEEKEEELDEDGNPIPKPPKKKKIPANVEKVLNEFNDKYSILYNKIKENERFYKEVDLNNDRSLTGIIDEMKPEINLLISPVGCLKTEVCTMLTLQKGYEYIKVTNILQEASEIDDEQGMVIRECFMKRKTVPTVITLSILRKAILRSEFHKFIIDGYPRTVSDGTPTVHEQVEALEKEIGKINIVFSFSADKTKRQTRMEELTPAQFAAKEEIYEREKFPVVSYFKNLDSEVPALILSDCNEGSDSIYQDIEGYFAGF